MSETTLPAPRGLDDDVARLLRGHHVRVAAGIALGLLLRLVATYWDGANLRYRLAVTSLVSILLLLAYFGPTLERPFLRVTRSRWSPALVVLGWVVLGVLSYNPVHVEHLGSIVGPFTACWFLARGWPAAGVIVVAWAVLAMAMLKVPALAPLPAFALLLRRRPTLAFFVVLAVGALLRLTFSVAVPRPMWSWDSGGYTTLAYQWLSDAPVGSGFARPPYVSALLLGSLLIGRSHFAYVLAAHALGFVLAWWTSAALRRRLGELAGWQACVALALAPELMFYEHTLMSEATFLAFMTVLAVKALDLRRDAAPSTADAISLGLATGLVASARPVAMLAPVLVFAAALVVRWPRRRLTALVAGCAAPILIVCSFNLATNGFFGVSSPEFRAFVWFSVTGHRVVLDSPLHAQIKREMRPAIERHNEVHPPWNPETNSLIWASDGPLATSKTLQSMPIAQQRVIIEELAREAILHDPFGFATRVAYQLFVRYLLAPRHWNDSHVYQWEDVVAADRTEEFLPPSLAHLLHPPAVVQPLEGERLFRPLNWAFRVLRGGVGTPAYGSELFSLYKEPWILLGLLAITWWRAPRLRIAALSLIALGALMIAVTCVVQEPIPRYRLQVYPLCVVLAAMALAGRPGARSAPGE